MSYGGSRGGSGYGIGALLNAGQGDQVNAASNIENAINIENAQSAQQRESELGQYQLQGAKMQSDLEQATYNDSMIAHAAKTANGDPDQWDQNFRALDEKGIPGARQWIGRFSPAAMDAIDRGYDPQSPLARAARPSKSEMSPGSDTDYDRLFSQTPADQIPAIADKTGRAMDLLASVKDAPTWEAAKAQAAKLGMQTQSLGAYSPLKVQMLYEHLLGIHDYLAGRTADQGLGIPAPNVASKTATIGDTLYSLNEETPSGVAQATEIAHVPESTFVGTDKASGRPVYHDTRPVPGTQADTMGPYVVQPKGNARPDAFTTKQQAWLTLHPGDGNGALAFAGGQKQMSPQEITKTALQMATSDLHNAVQNQETIPDPNAYVEQRRRQYEADLSQQSNPQTAGGNGQQRRQQYDTAATLASAHSAIKRGAPRAAVIARLKQAGISTAGF